MRASAVALVALGLVGCTRSEPKEAPDPPAILEADAGPSPLAGLLDAGEVGSVWLIEPETGWAVTDANGDGIDDVVALAHTITKEDDSIRLVAVDGKTNTLLWKGPPIRPWEKVERSQVLVLAAGGNIALTAGWSEAQLFDARSGARKSVVSLSGITGSARINPAKPSEVYVGLSAGGGYRSPGHPVGGAILDVAAGSATDAERPAWAPAEDSVCRRLWLRPNAGTCRGSGAGLPLPGKPTEWWGLTNGGATIAIGNGPRIVYDSGASNTGYPEIVRLDATSSRIEWRHVFRDEPRGEQSGVEEAIADPHYLDHVELQPEGLLVVQDVNVRVEAIASRLYMLDPKSGAVRWRRTYARRFVVSPRMIGRRIYVPRLDGYERNRPSSIELHAQLDVIDATDGHALYTIGTSTHGW